ncbi:MAG TPA: type II toxin-antitoxin system MqsA family antitoxin [Gelria sp.]|jgi:YgiT-type zinc finger domain-containing protein|nr:type II toxin-antitoxin system MqsA family antitoxin [Gelria sp.]
MNCSVCKNGELFNTVTDYQTKFKGEYIVVRNVPVQQCNVCGEYIMSYATIKQIEDMIQSKKKPDAYIEVSVFDMTG